MAVYMKGRHLVSLADLTAEEIYQIFDLTIKLKLERYSGRYDELLAGMSLGMIFEKPSLRTRVSFEVAMGDLGGHAIYLGPADIQMGKRETTEDIATVLSSMVHGIMARTFKHESVTELAKYSRVPVINALSDYSHPMQGLADYFTILEKLGTVRGVNLTYIGDGNNVAHSLIFGGAILGANVTICTPKGHEPLEKVVTYGKELAFKSKGTITVTNDVQGAAKGADVLYTDVWVSMGQEGDAGKENDFAGYSITMQLLEIAKPGALIMHCLPAHYGEEIEYDVIREPGCVIYDQAENRLHTTKAVLALLM
jgi:ornithine carbamoyltransferase